MKKVFALFAFLFLHNSSSSALHLPNFFGNGMVLQRNMKIPVWGEGLPNEKIAVRLNHQIKKTKASASGKWEVYLDEEPAGGPYKLKVSGKENIIEFNDVLIGDVWLCSGQSNMEFTVNGAENSETEISSANYPMIRQIKISKTIAEKPMGDVATDAGWKTAIPADVGNFTAVGYFFARELFKKNHVPIGLINSTWGGTDVETWTSKKALESDAEFKEMIKRVSYLNLDSLANEKKKVIVNNVIKVQGNEPGRSDPLLWKLNTYNDSLWPLMTLPGLWESQSLPDLDGIVWFRKKVVLSEKDILKVAKISLGMIDDNEETFINGVKIGSTKGYNIKRVYTIPQGFLKPGENIIAVRVEDTGGGGGIYGDTSDLYLSTGENKIPLQGSWLFQVESIKTSADEMNPNRYPSLLYNGMINPLIPYGIKGVLWYQGENNSSRAYQYRKAFPLMINDWRSRWSQGNFPFYFVQLSSFNAYNGNSRNGSSWAELREAQAQTLSLPNTAMVVTTDIGNAGDIHPRNKQDVGKRLAAVALQRLYGYKMNAAGPSFLSMVINNNVVLLSFKNTGKGLMVRNNDLKLTGFEIAGNDKIFYPAQAVIKGAKVLVSSSAVLHPVAVRYAWADDAGNANLFNTDGFPAEPFRTDKWNELTKDVKYNFTNNQ